MNDAAFAGTAELQDPIAFRDVLIILCLILVPVRITQFSLIQLDRHLKQGEQNEWLLHWEAEETNTGKVAIHPLPPALVEVLDYYLRVVPPALLRKAPTSDHTAAL